MDLFSAILSATKQIAHDTPDSNQNKVINRYKGLVNTQIKILWLFIHTRIVPNMYERIQIVILGRMTAAVTFASLCGKKVLWESMMTEIYDLILCQTSCYTLKVIQVWKTWGWVNDDRSLVFVNCCFKSCFPCAWIKVPYICAVIAECVSIYRQHIVCV